MHSSIFGDINHPSVVKLWQEYLHNMNAYQIIHTVILEICSKKYVIFNEKTVCNDFYFNERLKHKQNIDDTYIYGSNGSIVSQNRARCRYTTYAKTTNNAIHIQHRYCIPCLCFYHNFFGIFLMFSFLLIS